MEGSLVAYKVFTNGSVLQASEINDNLMNQSVMVFSNAAARTAAITSPSEGMVSYLQDTDLLSVYESGSWRSSLSPRGGVLQVVSGSTSTSVSSSVTSYVDTGLTATITPKSISSVIYVILNQAGVVKTSANSSNGCMLILIYPNGSNQTFGYAIGFTGSAIANYNSVPGQGVYTHGTLSPITFKTQFANLNASAAVQVQDASARSQITLIEVAN
jgi:hypothetical protein